MRLKGTSSLERTEVYEKAMELRLAGVRLKEIANVVSVPLPTLKEWARGLYKPSMCKQPKRMSARRRIESYKKALELKREGLGPTQIAKIRGTLWDDYQLDLWNSQALAKPCRFL